MKIFGLDIPLPLVDLYYEYVSKQKQIGATDYITRRRRKAGKVIASKSARLIEDELKHAAEYIAGKLNYSRGSTAWNEFVFAETERLKDGTADPAYWIPCQVNTDVYYNSTATCTEDINPPPYSHRMPTMKPSDVTYSTGTSTTAPVQSTGSVADNLWHDASWRWRKTVFSLMGAKPANNLPPLLWRTEGTISVNATTRASRPMFSLLMRGHLVGASSPWDTDLTPPAQPATSLYWRYPPPDTPPPYYSAKLARRNIVVLNDRATKDDTPDLQRAIVKSSVRPMLGHGYNNNMSVTTSYDGTSELFTANPCLGKTSATPLPAEFHWPTPTVNSYNTVTETIYTNKYFDAEYYWRVLAEKTANYGIIDIWKINPGSNYCILVPRGQPVQPSWVFIATLPRMRWIYYNGLQSVRFLDGFYPLQVPPYYYSNGHLQAQIEFSRPACSK